MNSSSSELTSSSEGSLHFEGQKKRISRLKFRETSGVRDRSINRLYSRKKQSIVKSKLQLGAKQFNNPSLYDEQYIDRTLQKISQGECCCELEYIPKHLSQSTPQLDFGITLSRYDFSPSELLCELDEILQNEDKEDTEEWKNHHMHSFSRAASKEAPVAPDIVVSFFDTIKRFILNWVTSDEDFGHVL